MYFTARMSAEPGRAISSLRSRALPAHSSTSGSALRIASGDTCASVRVPCKAKRAPADEATAGEAYAIYEALLYDKEVSGTAARLTDLIHFRYGEALLKTGRTEQAAAEFLAAAKSAGADEGLATMAHLYAARSLDACDKRPEAVAQYHVVLSRPDVYDAHEEARQGLRERYKSEAGTRMKSR